MNKIFQIYLLSVLVASILEFILIVFLYPFTLIRAKNRNYDYFKNFFIDGFSIIIITSPILAFGIYAILDIFILK